MTSYSSACSNNSTFPIKAELQRQINFIEKAQGRMSRDLVPLLVKYATLLSDEKDYHLAIGFLQNARKIEEKHSVHTVSNSSRLSDIKEKIEIIRKTIL